MDFFGATLLTLSLLLTLLFLYYSQKRRPKNYPPGPVRLPIIGNLHQLGFRPYQTFMQMREKYGDIIAIDFGSYSGVVLNEPKLIREAFNLPELSGRIHLHTTKVRSGNDGRIRGLAFADGKSWTEQRRFALKTLRDFGFGKKPLEMLIQDEVNELIQILSKLNGKPYTPGNAFNLAAINALWKIVAGQRFSFDDKRLIRIVELFTEGLTKIPASGAFFFFPWICECAPNFSGVTAFMEGQITFKELAKEQLNEHRASFQKDQLRDYLDACIQEMIQSNDPESSFYGLEGDLNLLVSLTDLFRAGSESTSTSMSWAFLFLSIYPEVQEKLFNEIKNIVGMSRVPCLADRPNMPYTEATLMEVLRLSSISPIEFFHRAVQQVKLDKYVIPEDTVILSNLYGVHHDHIIWGDPNNFRPERFINEENGSVNRHHEGFMPFSTGKRVCLGESLARDQLFLFLTTIFQKFCVKPNPMKPKPDLNDHIFKIILMPKPCEYIFHERI